MTRTTTRVTTEALCDAAIRTEWPKPESRAAQSAAIETLDYGPLAPAETWVEPGGVGDRVRALLAPLTPQTFIQECYERDWLFIEGGDLPRPHAGLYSVAALLNDVRDQRIPRDALRFLKRSGTGAAIDVPAETFAIRAAARGAASERPLPALHYERVAEYVERGRGSLVIHRIEQYVPEIFDLVAELAELFRSEVQVNAYFTPAGSKTFDVHWDTHDVMVLQLEGEKPWQVYDTLVPLPLGGRDYMASSAFDGYADRLRFDALTLWPGDTLYLPRGVPHVAWTDRSASFHLTVGFLQPTWIDVFETAAAAALRACEKRLVFRRICPGLFASADPSAVRRIFDELADTFSAKLRATDPCAIARGGISTVPLRFHGGRAGRLEPSTLVERIPCVLYHGHDGGTSWLQFNGRTVRLPVRAAHAVDFVVSRRRFAVHEMPGLEDDEKEVLTERLVREGLLAIAEPLG